MIKEISHFGTTAPKYFHNFYNCILSRMHTYYISHYTQVLYSKSYYSILSTENCYLLTSFYTQWLCVQAVSSAQTGLGIFAVYNKFAIAMTIWSLPTMFPVSLLRSSSELSSPQNYLMLIVYYSSVFSVDI